MVTRAGAAKLSNALPAMLKPTMKSVERNGAAAAELEEAYTRWKSANTEGESLAARKAVEEAREKVKKGGASELLESLSATEEDLELEAKKRETAAQDDPEIEEDSDYEEEEEENMTTPAKNTGSWPLLTKIRTAQTVDLFASGMRSYLMDEDLPKDTIMRIDILRQASQY